MWRVRLGLNDDREKNEHFSKEVVGPTQRSTMEERIGGRFGHPLVL
jgi:hypothetical protein